MTPNYKWYRLLSADEVPTLSLYEILRNHSMKGYDVNSICYHLIREWNRSGTTTVEMYKAYSTWWKAHFGTKLHKYLAGVENVD